MTDQDFHEQPLLNYPDLMLLVLKAAAAQSDPLALLRRGLELAEETPQVAEAELRAHLDRAQRYLAGAGAIALDAQGARATPRGLRLLKTNPTGIDDTVLMQYPEFRAFLEREHEAPKPAEPGVKQYGEGYAAFERGEMLTSNPYRFDSSRHLAWENGWHEARDERLSHEREDRP